MIRLYPDNKTTPLKTGSKIRLYSDTQPTLPTTIQQPHKVDLSKIGAGSYMASQDPLELIKTPRDYAGVEEETGSQRDHIIAVALGGTSDAENIKVQAGKAAKNKDNVEKYYINEYKKGNVSLETARLKVINWDNQDIPGQKAFNKDLHPSLWNVIKETPNTLKTIGKTLVSVIQKIAPSKVLPKYLQETRQQLQTPPLEAIKEAGKAAIQTPIQAWKGLEEVSKETLTPEMKQLPVAQKVANILKFTGASANVLFTPIMMAFNAAEKVPGLKQAADIISLPFVVGGKIGGFASGKFIDVLPIPQKSKDTLKPAFEEIGSLAGMIILGGKIMETISKGKKVDTKTIDTAVKETKVEVKQTPKKATEIPIKVEKTGEVPPTITPKAPKLTPETLVGAKDTFYGTKDISAVSKIEIPKIKPQELDVSKLVESRRGELSDYGLGFKTKEEALAKAKELSVDSANTKIYTIAKNWQGKSGFRVLIGDTRNISIKDFLKTPEVIPAEKGIIPKDLQPLAQEARKYKSAEEFVKAFPKSKKFGFTDYQIVKSELPLNDNIYQQIIKYPEYRDLRGTEITREIKKPITIFAENPMDLANSKIDIQDGWHRLRQAIQNKDKSISVEVMVDKSQLTDFYNQAVKGVKEVKPAKGIVPQELQPLAKQYPNVSEEGLEKIWTLKNEIYQMTHYLPNIEGIREFKPIGMSVRNAINIRNNKIDTIIKDYAIPAISGIPKKLEPLAQEAGKVFDTKTGMPEYDNMLKIGKMPGRTITYREYFAKEKDKVANVVYMSPDEYLSKIPEGKPTQSSIDYMKKQLAKGEKLGMLSIDYTGKTISQEGRNRAYLAKEMGLKEIPVLEINQAVKGEMAKIEPTETKPSGIAKSIEAKAIENSMVKKGYDQLAGYDSSTIKAQSELASKYTQEQINKIATGKESLPERMKPGTALSIAEDYAMETKDGALARDLANSPLATQISESASEVSLSKMRTPDSATAKIREIQKLKEETVAKRMKGKTADKVKSEIKKSLKDRVEKAKPSKYSWESFVDSITC